MHNSWLRIPLLDNSARIVCSQISLGRGDDNGDLGCGERLLDDRLGLFGLTEADRIADKCNINLNVQ